MNNVRVDRYDAVILAGLQSDARRTWRELGEAANLSATAVQRRVEALKEKGVIAGFTIMLDLPSLGHEVRAFASVNVDRQKVELADAFRRIVNECPEVQACYMLTGDVDFLLDIVAPDLPSYGRFIEREILSLPGVKDASSRIVLDTVKPPQTPIPARP